MKMTKITILTIIIFCNSCSLIFPEDESLDLSPLALLALGGGSASSSQLDLSPGSTIDLTNNGGATATLLDTNGDGISDGIDLTGDGVPNILLLDTNGDGSPDAIDIDGDGEADYYLNPNGNPALSTGLGGTGQPVVLIVDSSGSVVGFDTDGDGTANDTSIAAIIQDTTAPTVNITPATGLFSTSQSISINCTDNTAPGHIIYSINSGNPSFPSTGTYVSKASTSFSQSTDGSYLIRAICRDLAGNTSAMAEVTITIDSNVPNVTISSQTATAVSINGGAINSSTINWTTNRAGDYTVRQDSTDCTNGTAIEGPLTVTANESKNFTRTAAQLSSEGIKNFRICVTSSSNLTGSITFSIRRDDTAPVASNSPGSGIFASATSVSLSCSDAGAGCDKIAYITNVGSAPGNPAITGSTGAVTAGTQYASVPVSTTDAAVTYIKFLARDNAGNVSNPVSADYTVDTTVGNVTINSSSTYVHSSSNASINWQTNKAGSYTVRIGGTNCTDGATATGTNVNSSATANTPISTSINPGSLSVGANTVRICVVNLVGNYGSQTATVTKDENAPTVAFDSPAAGGPYVTGTTFTSSCSDTGASGCQKIAFTTNGSDPTFDGTGNITNGTLYSGSNTIPNGASVTVKVRSRDNAGNESAVVSRVFNVGPPPTPTLSAPTAGLHKLTLTWSASSGATSYKVYYGTAASISTSSTLGCNVTAPTVTCEITSLNPGTTYYVRVTAIHAGGESALSNELSGVPTDYPEVNFCSLYEYPGALVVTGSLESPSLKGEVYHPGITESFQSPRPNSATVAELGYGPGGTNPIDHPGSWTFISITNYTGQDSNFTNNEVYAGTFTAPSTGIYNYVFRFAVTNVARKTLCDRDSSNNTFDKTKLGEITFQ
ncbi:chitobiase/beta-hexosaminidase C-terminal domain-containing protein [Leptospira sp. GIMC2001]|uniref:chitobiase/beta-hexosaminidase C-terminal domain-containing protein n=1 Tax=Leptospira sp. GIMC2001 TaxID=1513297 RepID=UPI002349C81B|nr:chitobiase/beta-hexosaminidase C-terminal domain-containing protein [Leptospira sp. GIMC2001]WCL50068.1 chitobiase/beta-hexosaminidase C-terminal domain-containing protein [Leptospira sp. GIMC2001]